MTAPHPLDPGETVRAVWHADTDRQRALKHFRGNAHIDFDAWGDEVYAKLRDPGYAATWLDWGCGGGAIAAAVDRHAHPSRYYAVDIDDAAIEQTAAIGHHVMPLKPWDTHTIADASIDYVVSTSCFQHFPSFEYAREVLREMRRVSRGAGLIQSRYFVPGDGHDPSARQCLPYAKAFINYCAWQVSAFVVELESAGFRVVSAIPEDSGRQYAWYSVEAR